MWRNKDNCQKSSGILKASWKISDRTNLPRILKFDFLYFSKSF